MSDLIKLGSVLGTLLEATQKCCWGNEEEGGEAGSEGSNPSAALQFAQAFNLIATAIGEKYTIKALER